MKRSLSNAVVALVLVVVITTSDTTYAQALPPAAERDVDFARDIQPILTAHCAECHGRSKQESGLRLDRRENLLSGGDHGDPAVVPGESAQSFLIQVVSGSHSDLRMPPEGDLLSPDQIGLLRAWIDQGVKMPAAENENVVAGDHWSLQPLRPARPPDIDDPFVANPIDAFILARLRENGLARIFHPLV